MTLEEIRESVERGKAVYWQNSNYRVIKDNVGQWLIVCSLNNSCIGLTWLDNVTMNGKPEEFYIG